MMCFALRCRYASFLEESGRLVCLPRISRPSRRFMWMVGWFTPMFASWRGLLTELCNLLCRLHVGAANFFPIFHQLRDGRSIYGARVLETTVFHSRIKPPLIRSRLHSTQVHATRIQDTAASPRSPLLSPGLPKRVACSRALLD